MPETITPIPGRPERGRIHWGRAITAGLIATIVMTIVMVLMKMNLLKMLGSMIVGSNASAGMQYAAGGAMHMMIGVVYGVIYAAIVGWLVEWNRFIKGAMYGLAIAAIALAAMPVMSAMMGGGSGAQNPCGGGAMNPCHGKQAAGAMNPCHGKEAAGAMNPCHGKQTAGAMMNPCHPAAAKNPCHAGGAGNPCNPCGGGGGGSPWAGVLSVVNHLVYALTLAFVYGKAR